MEQIFDLQLKLFGYKEICAFHKFQGSLNFFEWIIVRGRGRTVTCDFLTLVSKSGKKSKAFFVSDIDLVSSEGITINDMLNLG